MPPEADPRLVFERLFSSGIAEESDTNRAARLRYRKSILDFVLEDADQLKRKLGYTDQRKLDEYLTAVRELEMRIEQSEKFVAALPDYRKPTGIPGDNEQHIRLMLDLLTLAFQTDTTRIATYIVAHDGSNRLFIVEQTGRIKMLPPGATTPTVYLDLSSRVLSGGEQGLLGLAFHPQFASNRRFFVDYTRQPDGATEVWPGGERLRKSVRSPAERHRCDQIAWSP